MNLHVLSHWILTKAPGIRLNYLPFTDEGTKALRCLEIYPRSHHEVTGPKPQSVGCITHSTTELHPLKSTAAWTFIAKLLINVRMGNMLMSSIGDWLKTML